MAHFASMMDRGLRPTVLTLNVVLQLSFFAAFPATSAVLLEHAQQFVRQMSAQYACKPDLSTASVLLKLSCLHLSFEDAWKLTHWMVENPALFPALDLKYYSAFLGYALYRRSKKHAKIIIKAIHVHFPKEASTSPFILSKLKMLEKLH